MTARMEKEEKQKRLQWVIVTLPVHHNYIYIIANQSEVSFF